MSNSNSFSSSLSASKAVEEVERQYTSFTAHDFIRVLDHDNAFADLAQEVRQYYEQGPPSLFQTACSSSSSSSSCSSSSSSNEINVLDVGCGGGNDLSNLLQLHPFRFRFTGIDASESMIQQAHDTVKKRQRLLIEQGIWCDDDSDIAHRSTIELKVKFADEVTSVMDPASVDMIISRFVLQTIPTTKMSQVWQSLATVCKNQGLLYVLFTHPLRQFFEKEQSTVEPQTAGTDHSKTVDYFESVNVTSKLFHGAVTVVEPSHTITDYFSPLFFQYFRLLRLIEGRTTGHVCIGNRVYPAYLSILARREDLQCAVAAV